MIVGTVTAGHEAVIRVTLLDRRNQEREVEADIDTGFTGWLTLPPDLITAMNLPWRRRGRGVLADGRDYLFDLFEATILWDGQPRPIRIAAADANPLIGMRLMQGYELIVQITGGGRVSLERMERKATG